MKKYLLLFILICFDIASMAQTKKIKGNIDTTIYKAVETSPKPLGGDAGLVRYLQKHLHYPGKLRDEDVGKYTVMKWVVEKDGSLSNFVVIKGASPELGNELIRVFKSMPKWSPGMQKGKKVRAEYVFAGWLE